MKRQIIALIEAICIVSFVYLFFLLYLRITTSPEKPQEYQPYKPVVLSDTTYTWPDPDSLVDYGHGVKSMTYKEKTLAYIEKRF